MSTDDVYADQAKRLVDEVIDIAIKRLETNLSLTEREKTFESLKAEEFSRQSTFVRDDNFEVKNIKWLTISEFSAEKAEQKIHEFIKRTTGLTRYRFRVRWSIPTRRKPIPRATACVYFSFVVSSIKPGTFPVDVFYVFETHRLVHKPGESRFREKWLKDIIENKVMMMQVIEF
ncbi:A-kinase anchor protein 14-like [Saccostrea cucullata]|uniref:A-kinase anchor protein 14-like n=1 Tax=Saccostrea cuccullata TaxID=36930 RepID=UPI002ED41CE5